MVRGGGFIVEADALALKDGQGGGAHDSVAGGTKVDVKTEAARINLFPSGK